MGMLAYFFEQLDAIKENDGSVFDTSMTDLGLKPSLSQTSTTALGNS